jgi:predicted esterase
MIRLHTIIFLRPDCQIVNKLRGGRAFEPFFQRIAQRLNIMKKDITLKYSCPSYTDLGKEQKLIPLFENDEQKTINVWEQKREELLIKWEKIIGKPSFTSYDKKIEIQEKFEHPEFYGTLLRQSTGPNNKQLVLIMEPKKNRGTLRPGAIVPFYQPDASAGFDLTNRKPLEERETIQFGLHLVRQGYVAVCTEAFPFNTIKNPEEYESFAIWQKAADKILKDNPHWTGIGKLIWDTSRAVDLLLSLDKIDTERIVIIGHSLGGKMAFCTAAFDQRIKGVIASDFGIGWDFTNWDSDWYFGKQIFKKDFQFANHQLAALIAPRSFLIIAGEYDKPASWQYINEAKVVYDLYQKKDNIGMFDHASGHRPPDIALDVAYQWLAEQFGLPFHGWKK